MYLQKVDHFKDIQWVEGVSYGDVYMRNEQEQAAYAFEHSTSEQLFEQFLHCETESIKCAEAGLALPAYEQCIKSSHIFNLLDARGVISVTDRAQYIRRVRTLALSAAQTWNQQSQSGA